MNKKTFLTALAFCLVLWGVAWATTFSDSIDISAPAGGDDPSEADDNMRRIQAGFQQRLTVDHIFDLDGNNITVDDADTGEHRKITYNVTIADPTPVASKSHLYMQNDELRYQDDSNSAFDLTSAGKLGSASTDLTVNNAVMAGTLEATGLTTVADGSVTKTTAAPSTDAMLANKKYVDDTVIQSNIKAWVNFDGDTGTIADSFNVTSVTRTGAGTYTIVWDTNFADANYCISGMAADATQGGWVAGDGDSPLSAGQALIRTVSTAHAEVDFNLVTVIAVGDQ